MIEGPEKAFEVGGVLTGGVDPQMEMGFGVSLV